MKPTGASIKEERLRDLLSIDAQILELIAERSRLLRKESAWRRSKGQSRIDPALEKGLWAEWEQAGKQLGVGPKLLRQLFNQVNLLGDESAQIKRRADTGYVLRPRHEKVCVSTPAPRSLSSTRMWTALAAASGQAMALPSIIQNDPLVELIKGLNQAGAGLSWGDDGVECAESELPLDFEDKLIFVGDDPLNLYLLIALALTGAGRVKFAGGAGLKLMDITVLNAVLPALGARIVPLNPHGKGLPARLECGGSMDSEILLPKDAPTGLAGALALIAWAFPTGLNLKYTTPGAAAEAAEAVALLTSCGVKAVSDANSCTVSSGIPILPEFPEATADAVLCAYLLSLPIFADGKVTLTHAPKGLIDHPALKQLAGLGVDIETLDGTVTASAVKLPDRDIDLGHDAALLPLGLALALRAKRELTVALPDSEDAADSARQFLDRMGANYRANDNSITITPSKLSWEGTWTSPDPYYCLASALAAFVNPGISLENPGQLTSLWPQFWNIYNTLPTGKMKSAPVKEIQHDQPKRRRIKI